MSHHSSFTKNYSEFPASVTPRSLVRDLALRAVSKLRSDAVGPAVRLFYCHYVFDDQIAEFEKKIVFLKQRGRFVSGNVIRDILVAGRAVNENTFHISFD